jgi:hypothetical protein
VCVCCVKDCYNNNNEELSYGLICFSIEIYCLVIRPIKRTILNFSIHFKNNICSYLKLVINLCDVRKSLVKNIYI